MPSLQTVSIALLVSAFYIIYRNINKPENGISRKFVFITWGVIGLSILGTIIKLIFG